MTDSEFRLGGESPRFDFWWGSVIFRVMKVVLFNVKDKLTPEQQKVLSSLGEVTYLKSLDELPLQKLLGIAKGADLIGVHPYPLGGYEKAKGVLTKIMDSLPYLKGVCLTSTAFGWVDLDYVKERKIPVSNVPGYSSESVAEHTLAFLLGLSKRIFVSDRRYHQGKYKMILGFELKGKTLGIIGLGNIGSTTAGLASGLGMRVVAYNRSPKKMKGVKMVSFDKLLKESDAIVLHATHEDKNINMISAKEISKMKKGVIVVNMVERDLVDEKAMAKALKTGKVDSYGYEGEDLVHTPLVKLENAIGIQSFGWFTKEAMDNLYEIWTNNILSMAKGKPQNRVA